MSNHEKNDSITYLKAETYQKNFANFGNFVSQNLATPIAKFAKNFHSFLWGVCYVTESHITAGWSVV